MGRELTRDEETALETLMDFTGLVAILHSLSAICDGKGAHVLASYSDHALAKAWATAGGKLGMVETVTKGSTTLYEAAYTSKAGKILGRI